MDRKVDVIMQLTKGFEQAACIMVLLATQNRGIPLSSHVIHTRVSSSQTYLKKIMRKLVVGGLITSASGNSGGFSLAREPEDITLLQIVSAVEGEIHTYPNNGLLDLVFSDFKPIATEGNSAINAAFDAADQLWRQALDKVTIYDLLCQTLGTVDVPKVDWNKLQLSPSEQATAIIDKIRTNLRSVR